ncbi:NAD-dependent epimerase/dehydratase family protein [Burkholderia theae]|uniref:NAD-dependent epimerase/dehydratase family protein n=1 Tax=Burkholderia theae TaxID=3143496 RepID=UPI003AFAC34B
MKILVTGGNGFIGRHVVKALLDDGHKVAILDRKIKAQPNDVSPHIEYVYGSITDAAAIHEAMSEVDGFVHLAGVLGTQETIKNPAPAVHTNAVGGLNLLEAAAHYSVPGVNITIGNWWMNNAYSITKNMTERFVHMYNKERATRISNVRIVNTYGPGQSVAAPFGQSSVRKIMPSFICRALTGRDIEVYGSGEQVSDIVYVEDVARIISLELASVMASGPREYCLEIGSRRPSTVLETAILVRDIVADLGLAKVNIKHLPMRPGEHDNAVLSNEGADRLSSAVGALMTTEKNSILLSVTTSSMIRSLRNVVSANLSTLDHLDVDIDRLTPPEVGIAHTVNYYFNQKGVVWDDYR